MSWVALSLLAAVAFTANSILIKDLLDRGRMRPYALAGLAPAFHILPAIVILALRPPSDWASTAVLVTLLAGLTVVGVQVLSYVAFHREPDISRAVPVLDAFPVFVVILAVVFLDERLTPVTWAAAALVVAGAMIASQHQALPGERIALNRSVGLLVSASMLIAVATILYKVAVPHLDPWQMYGLSWVVAAPAYTMVLWATGSTREARTLITTARVAVPAGIGAVAMFAAFVTSFYAFESGPVTLASAIMSIRPLLVLAWVVLVGVRLARVWKGQVAYRSLRAQGVAAVLVTVGVTTMAVQ